MKITVEYVNAAGSWIARITWDDKEVDYPADSPIEALRGLLMKALPWALHSEEK